MMRQYWLWLAAKEELSAYMKNQLINSLGTPEHLYAMSRSELLTATRLNKRQVDALSNKSMDRAEAILYDCQKLNISIVTLEDNNYPAILRSIPDPPLVLYVKGTLPDLESAPGIGIVGTRQATAYGITTARQFGGGLATAGFTVISGMALGVDAAAARGALGVGGKTIAVFAGGLNICYPPENNFLMGDILLSGAVISENPPGTQHDGYRFPIRNRIISGLSRGVLIVEAPARSGALITAHLALDQGREVFAVPNGIHMPASAGCNCLIRDGEAGLVTAPQDIIQAMGNILRQPPDMEKVKNASKTHAVETESVSDIWDKILSPKPPKQEVQRTDADTIEKSSVPEQPIQKLPDTVIEPLPPTPVPPTPAREPKRRKSKPQTPAPKLPTPPEKCTIPERITGEQRQVAQAVLDGAGTPEGILEATGLPAARGMIAITMLELDGVIGRKNGRIIFINNPE